jgi:hypothetical protein
MQETASQYTARILGYQHGKAPVKVLAATPGKLERLMRGVSKQKLMRRPAPGQWSVAEILAHLADAEMVTGFRIRLVLGANGTPIQAFDQDVWAEFSGYRKQDPALSFVAFQAMRRRTVALLKTMPRSAWDKFGMHSERGKETVTRITEMMAGHDINHLRQVEAMLRPAKPGAR